MSVRHALSYFRVLVEDPMDETVLVDRPFATYEEAKAYAAKLDVPPGATPRIEEWETRFALVLGGWADRGEYLVAR